MKTQTDPAAQLADLLRAHAGRLTDWTIARRVPAFDAVNDAPLPGRYQTVKLEGPKNESMNLGLMIARAAELNAEEDPAGEHIVIGSDGSEIDPPSHWVAYVVTVVICGEVRAVEIEMDLETAKLRARSWGLADGTRLRAHSFAGDSYHTYTRLHGECEALRSKLDDLAGD